MNEGKTTTKELEVDANNFLSFFRRSLAPSLPR